MKKLILIMATILSSITVNAQITFEQDYINTDEFTIIVDDDTIGGAALIMMPTASQAPSRIYTVLKKGTTGNVAVSGSNGETINGIGGFLLTSQHQFKKIQNDGTAWYIIGQS